MCFLVSTVILLCDFYYVKHNITRILIKNIFVQKKFVWQINISLLWLPYERPPRSLMLNNTEKMTNVDRCFGSHPHLTRLKNCVLWTEPCSHIYIYYYYILFQVIWNCGGDTERISEFLDVHIQPLVNQLVPAVVKNNTDFLKKLKSLGYISQHCHFIYCWCNGLISTFSTLPGSWFALIGVWKIWVEDANWGFSITDEDTIGK